MTLPPEAVSLDLAGIEVTPELTAWAVRILEDVDGHPMGSTAGPVAFTVAEGEIQVWARVETHGNATKEYPYPHPHRGVTLYTTGIVPPSAA